MCASFVLFFYYLYWYLISRFWWASISRGSIFTSFNSQIWKRTLRFSISRSRLFQKVWPYWKKKNNKQKTKNKKQQDWNRQCVKRGGGGGATSHLTTWKQSARVLPADLCTDHAHYVKNHRRFSISYLEFSGLLVSAATPGRLWGHQFNRFFWLAMPFLTDWFSTNINFCILIGSWVGA